MSQTGKNPLQPVSNETTPAILRTRRLRQQFSSPTDNILSPCSQRLLSVCEDRPHPLSLGLVKSKLQSRLGHIPYLDDATPSLDKENVHQPPVPPQS